MTREADLTAWANSAIAGLTGMPATDSGLRILSGDASFRRYYRLRTPSASYIVVDAPPRTEDNGTFVRIADTLRQAGVVTPRILAVDYDRGFMLQEDFGDILYLQLLQQNRHASGRIHSLYRQAIDALVTMQGNVPTTGFPPYDKALLLREMQLFQDWFCERLGLDLEALHGRAPAYFFPASKPWLEAALGASPRGRAS